ncbi:MAG: IclR family transcriptional regulator [Firmicutes bacterium]|nr:IclR family transcriptional regulator [Bacillota bacterium]
MRERKARIVQAVDRSLAILEAMAREGGPMALGEISAEVELTRSTVHRLLATLISRGFVHQDPISGRYFLGLKALEVGASCLTTMDIRLIARPFLRNLARECGETANLAVLDGLDVVYIDQVETENLIKMRARLGWRGPAYCTAAGKALLADLPRAEVERLIGQRVLKRYTARTITEPERLFEELARIREEGYALDFGEMEPGVRCAAAPIRGHEGPALYAVSVSGPSMRINGERLRRLIVPAVLRAAEAIAKELGAGPRSR